MRPIEFLSQNVKHTGTAVALYKTLCFRATPDVDMQKLMDEAFYTALTCHENNEKTEVGTHPARIYLRTPHECVMWRYEASGAFCSMHINERYIIVDLHSGLWRESQFPDVDFDADYDTFADVTPCAVYIYSSGDGKTSAPEPKQKKTKTNTASSSKKAKQKEEQDEVVVASVPPPK